MALRSEIQQWVTGQDGIDNLVQEKASTPQPGEGEVLVKIHAVSLNYRDTEGMCTCTVQTKSMEIFMNKHGPPRLQSRI